MQRPSDHSMTSTVDDVRPLLATGPAPRKADSVAFHSGRRPGAERAPSRPRSARPPHDRLRPRRPGRARSASPLVTYLLARNYLLDQRQSGAVTQALVNARLIRDVLRDPAERRRAASSGRCDRARRLRRPATTAAPGSRRTPGSTRTPCRRRCATPSVQGSSGTPALRRSSGTPYVGVGVYTAEIDAAYLEVFSMAEPPAHAERHPHVAAGRLGHRHRRRRRLRRLHQPPAPAPADPGRRRGQRAGVGRLRHPPRARDRPRPRPAGQLVQRHGRRGAEPRRA